MPAELGYAPADPAFIADPYPVLARLRADQPVAYDPATNQWLVSRFADVNALLRDRRLGRSYVHVATHEEFGRTPPPAWQAPFHDSLRIQLIDMEPPDHTRLRRLVSTAFTPRTVEGLRPRITELVDGLVSAARERGEFDLLADVIERLPVAVIAEMLGIPEEDRPLLRPWSADMTLMFELTRSEDDERRAVQATIEFSDYVRGMVRERRASPRADLLGQLALVGEAGDRLSEDELIATAILLLNAGHEASVNGAANAWWTLFRHPAALADLRADPGLVPTAVEELLRFDTPAPMFERWVLEEIELHGFTIPRGPGAGAPLRVGQPGRVRVRGRRAPGPRSQPEPAPLVRRRDPLLPRGTPRAPRDGDPLPRDPRADADPRARRGAGLEAALHPARAAGAARPRQLERVAAVLHRRVHHRQDVLRRDLVHDRVDRREEVAPTRRERRRSPAGPPARTSDGVP